MKKIITGIAFFYLFLYAFIGESFPQGTSGAINLGAVVNSDGENVSPSISYDGNSMLFSMKKKGGKYSHIYICSMKDGKWSEPEPMEVLNSDRDDAAPFMSYDGSLIVFSSNREGSSKPKEFKGDDSNLPHDIYISFRTGNEWSKPEKVSDNINTENNERSPSLNQENSILYFTRWPGNDMDKARIMMVHLTEEGFAASKELEAPVNDGYASHGFIQSRYREGFFFSSRRPGGFGSWDLYFAGFKSGKFSGVTNLGPEINSASDELFVTEVSRDVIYFSSNRPGGIGRYDLYSSNVPSEFSGTPVVGGKDGSDKKVFGDDGLKKNETGFNFKIVREGTRKPLSVKLKLMISGSDGSGSEQGKSLTGQSDKDGNFTFIADPGVSSVILESLSPDIVSYKKEFMVEAGKIKDITIGLKQKTDDRNGNKDTLYAYVFNPDDFKPIYFENNSSIIKIQDYPYIYDIINYLRKNKNARLKIMGHSGITQGCGTNEKISLKRAMSVGDYIISFGIDKNRIIIKGYGKKYPLDDKFNEMNRRVEFVLVK